MGKKSVPASAGWAGLTWDDLEDWAGSRTVSRGRTYQRAGRVKELRISADGELLATVQGTERYATTVSLPPGSEPVSLESTCTCPVGISCKHAVATVAHYLQAIADGRTVPIASEDDTRWDDLEDAGARVDDDDDDESWDDDEEDIPISKPRASRSKPKAEDPSTNWDARIERHIRQKTQAELADLAWGLTRRFPEVYQEFRERIALQSGDVAELLAEARREIGRITSQPAWSNHWKGESHIPDYSPIRHRFERLLEMGHADEVVALGREFIQKGFDQVQGANDDEGETGSAFAACLPVIFQAAMKSSLAPADRILFAIDTVMDDDYDFTGEAAGLVLDATWEPEDWSAVADALTERLEPRTVEDGSNRDGFSRDYRRDRLTGWIAGALEDAGRVDEVTALYESEVRFTNSYQRLVNHLLKAGRVEDAERWAKEGIAQNVEKYPGISGHLAEKLCELARERKQWDVVASHAAREFFDRPHPSSFDKLMEAARKAGVEGPVREVALRFLETGLGPFQVTRTRVVTPPRTKAASKKNSAPARKPAPIPAPSQPRLEVDPAWPLPVPDYLWPMMARRSPYDPGPQPHLEVLLEMAIAAGKPDEVLGWFDRMGQSKQQGGYWNRPLLYADRVAGAVSASHPDRAIEIYRAALEAQLPNAQQSAYEASAGYLRKLRPIYQSLGRNKEWETLLASIREKYRNRPRFMEILDRIDGRTILDSAKPRRK